MELCRHDKHPRKCKNYHTCNNMEIKCEYWCWVGRERLGYCQDCLDKQNTCKDCKQVMKHKSNYYN